MTLHDQSQRVSMRTRVERFWLRLATSRYRKRCVWLGCLILIVSVLLGNLGHVPIFARLVAKFGVVIGVSAIFLVEALHHFARANALSKRGDNTEGRPIFWIASGVVALALGAFTLVRIGVPLTIDLFTEPAFRYGTAEGRIRTQDRRLVWFEFEGDDRTFLLLLGPYLRTGENYRIVYLKKSLVVLDKNPAP